MMFNDWRDAARAHAHHEYPREACGLVVVFKGRTQYVGCANAAQAPGDQFVISAEDYERAEAKGEIVAVFHSHPDTSAQPSSLDVSACRVSCLPWHILSVPGGEWVQLLPESPTPALYGREFSHGTLDCYAFVRDWYAIERGITLPDFARDDEWWRKGQNLYLDNFGAAGFVQVRDDSLEPGDVLLMQVHADVPNHAAIFLGDGQIGHHLYGRLSSREVFGGYYRKHHTQTLRYAGHAA